MTTDTTKHPNRSLTQNSALHKYCEMVARELENGGHTMQDVVKVITRVEITPTTQNVKEILWREIQKALFGKKSTTELTTAEVSKVYEVMAMFLAREFQISLPFPSEENTEEYLSSYEKNN